MEKKRGAMSGGGGGWRWWDGMSPEVLALIFVRIPADMLIRTVPFVCRSWREAVAGPYCWSEIDLEQWCRRVNRSDVVDSAVRKLVRRSKGTLQRLSAYRLGSSGFSYAADYGKFLKVLQIPMSGVTDQMVERHAKSLSNLTTLDICYCLNITSRGIEVLGTHCKSLVQLRRNMPPPEMESKPDDGVAAGVDEAEAMAVANTMPKLQHLEFAFARFSDQGLDAILTKCWAINHLDIRGCWNVKMEGDVELKCELIQCLKDPWEDEYGEPSSSIDGGEGSDDQASVVDVDTSDESDDD